MKQRFGDSVTVDRWIPWFDITIGVLLIIAFICIKRAGARWGCAVEISHGKDTPSGHWEIAGLVLDRPFPTFPEGFPPDVIAEFERRIKRGTLGRLTGLISWPCEAR